MSSSKMGVVGLKLTLEKKGLKFLQTPPAGIIKSLLKLNVFAVTMF